GMLAESSWITEFKRDHIAMRHEKCVCGICIQYGMLPKPGDISFDDESDEFDTQSLNDNKAETTPLLFRQGTIEFTEGPVDLRVQQVKNRNQKGVYGISAFL